MAAIRSKRPVTPTFGTRSQPFFATWGNVFLSNEKSAISRFLTLNLLHFVKSEADFCANTHAGSNQATPNYKKGRHCGDLKILVDATGFGRGLPPALPSRGRYRCARARTAKGCSAAMLVQIRRLQTIRKAAMVAT